MPNDAEALAEFADKTFRAAFAIDNTPEDMEAYASAAFGDAHQREEIEDPAGIVLLAQRGDELVGYAHLRQSPDAPIQLERFYVAPELKGRGVAQTLMDEVLAAASARGARTIRLGVWERNPRAIAFYRKCGFVEVGTETFVLGADPQRDVVMERG
ncbi:MAG: GNAT family N-acetyltransferase, partial [Gemmatimonadota bacterium]|nr:GNAT family N-acetyltransferase [Gemmatimonadota bacterium]